MTLADECDVVYALMVDRIERTVIGDRLVAVTAAAAGAKVEMPTIDAALDRFDAALEEEPEVADADHLVLLDALGVTDGRRAS